MKRKQIRRVGFGGPIKVLGTRKGVRFCRDATWQEISMFERAMDEVRRRRRTRTRGSR